jgi:hypothetical protein
MGPPQISDTPFQGYAKVMSLYFSNIHISDTQIGRWFLWILYIKM